MANLNNLTAGNGQIVVSLDEIRGAGNITGSSVFIGTSANISSYVSSELANGWQTSSNVARDQLIGYQYYNIFFNTSNLLPTGIFFNRWYVNSSSNNTAFDTYQSETQYEYNKYDLGMISTEILKNSTSQINHTMWDDTMLNGVPITQTDALIVSTVNNSYRDNITVNINGSFTNITSWIYLPNSSITLAPYSLYVVNSTGGLENITPSTACTGGNSSTESGYSSFTLINGNTWKSCYVQAAYNIGNSYTNYITAFKYQIPSGSTSQGLEVRSVMAKVFLVSPINTSTIISGNSTYNNVSLTFYAIHQSATFNCSLAVNGTINQTKVGVSNNTNTTFNIILPYGNYNYRVNCTG